MILGVGLDLCEIERMGRAIEKEHFVDRVFTPAEAGRIRAAGGVRLAGGVRPAGGVCPAAGVRPAEIAAGLFAAKEAVAKALGTGFAGFGVADIEITPDDLGRPTCALHRGARARADALAGGSGWTVWVSVTHEKGFAAATAILEGGIPCAH